MKSQFCFLLLCFNVVGILFHLFIYHIFLLMWSILMAIKNAVKGLAQ